MMTSRLLPTTEYFDRLDPRRRGGRLDAPSTPLLRRVLAALGRQLRGDPLAYLNDHLRRDIGLDPMPKQEQRIWPW